jgi:signal transduction histidine kinase
MGSRRRSIRLRIYFLVAIPLVTMVGLLAYLAVTTVSNAISLDRAPNLVYATALPAARFGTYIEAERAAAVVYLFRPNPANLRAYQAAIAATEAAEPAFTAAMSSQATMGTETAGGVKAIDSIVADLRQLPVLRDAVRARVLTPLDALAAYSQGMATQIKLFLIQTESVVPTDQLAPAIGLIAAVQAREQLSQEDALLSGMLAGRTMTQQDRVAFTDLAADRQADAAYADSILGPADQATYNAALAGAGPMLRDLAGIEQAVAAGTPVTRLPVTLAGWRQLAGTLLTDEYNGGVAVVTAIVVADHQISHMAWVNVAVVSGAGLLGLLVTILVTTLVGRGIIRRLHGLESSALTLAENQLPDVIGRLRRGEEVDAAAEAPSLRVGRDEIGQVGQAFELVRQTAIRAAVDEARLRRGLNDVFRSLARRSQSLLHRQLALLDQMERRASDPEALDDLFRLDHLTTRMRRHAEGLVILSGAPPGRGWSSPVRMIDVMRGAIAEVEDYARVSVATRSQAGLSGSAVADVIHLLAELVENATTLSPPYTSVRVSGDAVASGFAIEVEDRGLGMSPERIDELNERLASPPQFNPSDSEQLGLFVVSQLAKRHDIRVTLRSSPYGGTAAIVLIPQHLVVTEEALRAGLPGGPAAIPTAPPANGHQGAAGPAGFAAPGGAGELGSAGAFPQAPGIRISGPLRRPQPAPAEGRSRGAHAAAPRGTANGGTGPADDKLASRTRADLTGGTGSAGSGGTGYSSFDVFAPLRRSQGAGQAPVPAGDSRYQGYAGSAPYPGAGAAPYPNEPAPSPGWTAGTLAGGPPGPAAPGPGGTVPPTTPMIPVASPRNPDASCPPWELSRQTGPLRVIPAGPEPAPRESGEDATELPRRVRQASLAPQLRADPPRRLTSTAPAARATGGPTPAEIRQTMSALQRGWNDGRSQQAAGREHASPPAAPATGASQAAAPGPDRGPNPGAVSDGT